MSEASSPVSWGLDTNVLVRYLVGDDPGQQETARRTIEIEHSTDHPVLIHPVMLVELVWVLRSAYKATKQDLLEALDLVLRIDAFHLIDETAIRDAVEVFGNNDVDFADALLHVSYQRSGAGGLATFDRKVAGLAGARLPGE